MKKIGFNSKKGVFFTSLVLVVVTLFLLSYSFVSFSHQRKLIQKRVETMNNFITSVEKDLQRKIFISGFRIIFLFEKRIVDKGDYITDVQDSFQEAFFLGTIEGQSNEEIEIIMKGATYNNITDDLNKKANKININITLTDPILTLTQEDPWNIKVTLETNLSMKDLSGLASWNITEVIVAYIPVENFEDPTHFIEVQKSNIIIKTPFGTLVNGVNSANLSIHINNTYYINSTEAPSFLDRLQGDLNSQNTNGIEAIINVPRLLPIYQDSSKSTVDHEYFSDTPATCSSFAQSPLPGWFKLDNAHLSVYGLTCS